MLRMMDIWRCAIVRQPVETIIHSGIDPDAIVWLPEMGPGRFRADPFGLWRDGKLYVFAETFDYHVRIGYIDVLVYDEALNLLASRSVLKEPWHLSYPFVFEADGETWMLPEAYKSGTMTLYRAKEFPFEWEKSCEIPLDGPAIDATPLFHNGKYWLLYAPSAEKPARRSHLHAAWSDHPTGPWHLHPANPVRIDLASARPGGKARVQNGAIILPVQDCRDTYGGAIRELVITRLDETGFEAADRPGLSAQPWMAPFTDGFHTLAEAGPVTLIDVKRLDASLSANGIRIGGIFRRRWRDAMSRRAAG
jgi:hypothetical protein